ncbi:sigma-70 family RNA polymerase sigma factor [Kutzneria kofuensis]|uniref:RNA polymerase sigma factor SigS n=1 Tax=Kutzneria kofuensis TaxID=103725 RepID=A0A7W9NF81_9PSEU|nr:sigma-70 family RNA polymerase sigma factor [Kutzneria kofuensis]MBB5889836.1 RNA polymerase sigma-70 factor (ECF subfamily) [Kutzneria kofuensis]
MPTQKPPSSAYWMECARIRQQLVRVAARRCVAPTEPEDIVQEAIIRGAEFDRLDMDRVPQFLTRLVTRLCVDEARHNAVVKKMASHPRLVPQSADDLVDVVCDHAEAQWLASRLEAFSPKDRKLVLMLTSGFTRKEIAEELGTTPQGTHSALYRIRKKMVERYG